ncbi:ABC transporter substrate-binding protein OS=Streptomyces alboniger OX=132473 GN=CP975_19710 PE=4 SV=1 [Streptomyces alboniger]
MQNALAVALPRGLQILPYGKAEDSDAFVVTRETAKEYGLKSLADLAGHNGKLVIGAAPEVKKRTVGVVGLKDVYGVEFKEFKSLDSSGPLVKGALRKGDVDVANLFTTDTDIGDEDWVVLTDPRNLIPGQHVVPLIADRKADSTVRKALARLGALLTTAQLTELNRLVDKDKKDPEDVAAAWAAEHGLTGK